MNRLRITQSVVLLCTVFSIAGQYNTSASFQANYKSWGWDTSYVLSNNLITMAIVPKVGGRIMQYDLGTHPFLWINPDLFGASYWGFTGIYGNFGGYKMWPAPQANWNAAWGAWPPPYATDQGPYSAVITANSADSSSVFVQSLVEIAASGGSKGLQFERTMTIYRGSSRVRVNQVMKHTDTGTVKWSIWDVTQMAATHPGVQDWGNFRAYFPKGTAAGQNDPGYFILRSDTANDADTQAHANIAPGISAVYYGHLDLKVGSSTDGGWLAYADERDGIVYVKRFPHVPGGEYPDSGSALQVFCNPDSQYVELEVMSPLQTLAQNASHSFTIDWYSAAMHGPVLGVNRAGAVNQHLAISSAGLMTGKFGVFYTGRVDLIFNTGSTVVKTYQVTPLDSLNLNETVTVPSGATQAYLCLYNQSGILIDTLDKAAVPGSGVITKLSHVAGWGIRIAGNSLILSSSKSSSFHITMFALDGRVVAQHSGKVNGTATIRFTELSPGTYLAKVNVEGREAMAKFSTNRR